MPVLLISVFRFLDVQGYRLHSWYNCSSCCDDCLSAVYLEEQQKRKDNARIHSKKLLLKSPLPYSQDCSVNTPLQRPSVDFAPAPSNDYRLASVYQNLIQNQHPTLEKGSSTVTSHRKTVTVPGKKKNFCSVNHTLYYSPSCVIVYDDVPYFHVNLNFLKFKKHLKLYRYCINI